MPTKISRLEVKIVPTNYKIRQLKICTSVELSIVYLSKNLCKLFVPSVQCNAFQIPP